MGDDARGAEEVFGVVFGIDTQPQVFFVPFAAALGKRVADKGLTLDAASRASTFGELNAESESAGETLRSSG